MRHFFTHKEIKLKKKRTAIAVIGIGLVLGIYFIVSRRPAHQQETPVVAIEPVTREDVEIYGEYVGRIRAQQFVEVRARVEGYLEQMKIIVYIQKIAGTEQQRTADHGSQKYFNSIFHKFFNVM